METKHTPGQWKITIHPAYPYEKRICGNSEEVAIVRNLTSNSEANAKLIASAPDLLRALNDLCEVMQPHIMQMKIKTNIGKGFNEHVALAYARKVIHKATEG